MDINKKIARMVGVLFIIGTAAGILSLIVVPILNAPDYLIKLIENKNRVILGVLLVLTMGISRGRLEFCVNGYNYHEGVDHLCKMLKVS